MKTTQLNLHDPDHVLQYISPLLRVISEGLDSGVSLGDSFFSNMEYDALLWCFMVRYGAGIYIRGLDPTDDWEAGPRLPMCGIEIRRLPCIVRVLKAQGDGPPPPGISHRRQEFYAQIAPRLPYPWEYLEVTGREGANLIVDWAINDRREISLHVSKPNGTWRYGQEQKLEWRREVIIEGDMPKFTGAEETDIPVGIVLDVTELRASGEGQ